MAIEIERVRANQSLPAATTDSTGVAKPNWLEVLRSIEIGAPAIGPRDRMFFTERLALLLDTGVPLHSALESLAGQTKHGQMAALTQQLNEDVKGGSTFGRALAGYPDVFPSTYVNLIGAAESGGFLPVALERLRDMEENREELRATLRSALSYPAILAVFSLAVVVFVLVVVFPKFSDIFRVIKDELPITTVWLMAASDIIRQWWLPIIIGIAIALQLVATWIRKPEGAALLDRVLLATPFVRDIVIQLNVVQMLRVLGLSLENGVGMLEALRAAREAVSSQYFRNFLADVENRISEGQDLHSGFRVEPAIPDLVKQMVETGEETGRLAMVMQRLADFYEREWRRAVGGIARIAEPAMLLIMGCVVGLIVSSLILPIFKISRAVH